MYIDEQTLLSAARDAMRAAVPAVAAFSKS